MRSLQLRVCLLGVLAASASVVPAHDAAAQKRPSAGFAQILELQPRLLDRELRSVQPGAAATPQLYFVGFAGYGSQAVFKREVLAVRALFERRFGTEGRSVVLINHPTTMRDVPLARIGALDRTLKHIGSVMGRDRDVLFLFLSSHGMENRFVVEMPRLGVSYLRPEQLKEMLKRSGIQNSVIVISACHSGSFLPALADPTTLVIAAARADRSSFGCDDRRKWTYFGDAFFNRALRQEASFARAFERASGLIAEWETRAKLEPSLPQMGGGEMLGPALAAIQPHH